MSDRSIKISDLPTTKENTFISLSVGFNSSKKTYDANVYKVEIKEGIRSVVFDFATSSHVVLEQASRFNAGKLKHHFENWKESAEVHNLILANLRARKLRLTSEAREFLGWSAEKEESEASV